MNQTIVVGRLINDIKKENDYCNITLAVNRCFKNENGEYGVDYIDCIIKGSLADKLCEYCNKGDLIGIKGRLETIIIDDIKYTKVLAEKITFLSRKEN